MIRASMDKALVIAEKPSVASDIAKALGGFTKHDDVFERDDMVIASAVGHLLEIVAPEKYDVNAASGLLLSCRSYPQTSTSSPSRKANRNSKPSLS
jgi:DNA topoisomerase IA